MQYLETVINLFFNNSSIIINPQLEGMNTDGLNLTLGCRAGPNIAITNLLHEMGHLIEISDERILKPYWGLKYKSIQIDEFEHTLPMTTKGLFRELRVFAIQRHLHEICQIKTSLDFREEAKTASFLLDYSNIDSDEKEEFCMEKMDFYYKSYTKELIMQEWLRKNQLIKNKMQF